MIIEISTKKPLVIFGGGASGKTTLAKKTAEENGTFAVITTMNELFREGYSIIAGREDNLTLIVEDFICNERNIETLKNLIVDENIVVRPRYGAQLPINIRPYFIVCTSSNRPPEDKDNSFTLIGL